MATKNVQVATMTALALVSEQALNDWLDDPKNYNKVIIRDPKTKAVKREAYVRKSLTLSANVPSMLYVAACNYAADMPGGRSDNNVAPGFLTKANRAALFSLYMPGFDYESWQEAEDARISSERSERMTKLAAERGVSVETLRQQSTLLEKLLANPKLRAAALEAADPEMLELIELLTADNDA